MSNMKKSFRNSFTYNIFLGIFLFSYFAIGQNNFYFEVQQPVSIFEINAGSDQVYNEDNDVILGGNPTALGGYGNYTFLWDHPQYLDNPNIANPTVINLTQTTIFTLTVWDSGGACMKQDQVLVDFLSTTHEHSNQKKIIHLYPNPFSDHINIRTSSIINSLSVYNIAGQLIMQKTINIGDEIRIELSSLQIGVYFLLIELIDGSFTTKKLCKTSLR